MADDFNSHQMESGEEPHHELSEINVADLEAGLDDEYQILSEAEFNMANTPVPEPSEPSTTADASSGSAPSTQDAGGESDPDLPSISSETLMSPGFQRAGSPRVVITGRIGEMVWMERMAQMEVFADSVVAESTLTSATISGITIDTGLEILESFPVVATKDLPEGHHDCPICQEAFGNKEDPEVPVRLPCQHIFGKLCISKWLSENTCPLCRATIYRSNVPSAVTWDGEASEPTLPMPQHIDGTEGEIAGSSGARIRELAAALARQAENLALVSNQRTALVEVSLHQMATLENILRDLRSLDT